MFRDVYKYIERKICMNSSDTVFKVYHNNYLDYSYFSA